MNVVSAQGLSGPLPQHHLSDDLLAAYAAGSLDEASSLFVASHLTLCPTCRHRASMLDDVGGVLLEDIAPVAMSAGALDAVLNRADGFADSAMNKAANDEPVSLADHRETVSGKDLPAPMRRYYGCDLDGIVWKRQGGGVSVASVPGLRDGSHAFMLKVEAGRAVPQHTHGGNELVMVLKGAYSDAAGRFGRGDVELADGDIDHQPKAEAGEDCICLAVTDAPLRFTGRMGWLLNIFVKM
ncbi:ChrR family anti-sigma-E factor [Hwanghaeella sp.]|uniref:ChrR family anti-sigma-E factor n=1 Tax=Hwanghaeella sp. TaxID=2605943 RepID=UPI003CCBA628